MVLGPVTFTPKRATTSAGAQPFITREMLLKSPARIASVGRSVVCWTKSCRDRGSTAKKKNVRSCPSYVGSMTGPPTASEPWSVRRLLGGRFVGEIVNGAALVAGSRWYQSAVPRSRFVPDLVVALMMPPPVCPNSAEYDEVWTGNSCTVSGVKLTTARARPTPVLLTPSARIAVLPGRAPLRLRLNPGTAPPPVTPGSSLPGLPETFGDDGEIEDAAVVQRNVHDLPLG